jgi:hypothetical protein
MDADYPSDDGPMNRGLTWAEIEAQRAEQEYRILFIRLGDIFADLAWLHIHKTAIGRPNLRKAGVAGGLLVKACSQYQLAGLTRKARSSWRYAKLLHRARWRAST